MQITSWFLSLLLLASPTLSHAEEFSTSPTKIVTKSGQWRSICRRVITFGLSPGVAPLTPMQRNALQFVREFRDWVDNPLQSSVATFRQTDMAIETLEDLSGALTQLYTKVDSRIRDEVYVDLHDRLTEIILLNRRIINEAPTAGIRYQALYDLAVVVSTIQTLLSEVPLWFDGKEVVRNILVADIFLRHGLETKTMRDWLGRRATLEKLANLQLLVIPDPEHRGAYKVELRTHSRQAGPMRAYPLVLLPTFKATDPSVANWLFANGIAPIRLLPRAQMLRGEWTFPSATLVIDEFRASANINNWLLSQRDPKDFQELQKRLVKFSAFYESYAEWLAQAWMTQSQRGLIETIWYEITQKNGSIEPNEIVFDEFGLGNPRRFAKLLYARIQDPLQNDVQNEKKPSLEQIENACRKLKSALIGLLP